MTSLFTLVVGPTASGKSDLTLGLAERFGGAILNCDSLQFYERLDIGTAKPSREERARVPHHLFDCVPPGQVLTAGDYRRLALDTLERLHGPVFGVGGSGFYIQALEKGMFDVPKPKAEVETATRARVEAAGLPAAYEELRTRDPEYAARVKPQDAYRITRALVLMDDAGRTVTEVRAAFAPRPFPYPLLKVGLRPTRDDLLPRVRARTARMLADGLIDETRALVDEGWGDWPPLQSVGYKECVQFLRGEVARADLEALIVEKTMQLAKKQRTWFQRDPEIAWVGGAAEAERLVVAHIDRLTRPS